MRKIKRYFDNFGNMATIEQTQILPYKESPTKQQAHILKIYATYDHNKLYYCSIYETEQEATNKLNTFSCGTFKNCTWYA